MPDERLPRREASPPPRPSMSEQPVTFDRVTGRRFVRAVKDFLTSEVRWRARAAYAVSAHMICGSGLAAGRLPGTSGSNRTRHSRAIPGSRVASDDRRSVRDPRREPWYALRAPPIAPVPGKEAGPVATAKDRDEPADLAGATPDAHVRRGRRPRGGPDRRLARHPPG